MVVAGLCVMVYYVTLRNNDHSIQNTTNNVPVTTKCFNFMGNCSTSPASNTEHSRKNAIATNDLPVTINRGLVTTKVVHVTTTKCNDFRENCSTFLVGEKTTGKNYI